MGFRDPMTGDKVDDLAISPYGHIMSYEVRWLVVVVVAVVVVVGGGFVVLWFCGCGCGGCSCWVRCCLGWWWV